MTPDMLTQAVIAVVVFGVMLAWVKWRERRDERIERETRARLLERLRAIQREHVAAVAERQRWQQPCPMCGEPGAYGHVCPERSN